MKSTILILIIGMLLGFGAGFWCFYVWSNSQPQPVPAPIVMASTAAPDTVIKYVPIEKIVEKIVTLHDPSLHVGDTATTVPGRSDEPAGDCFEIPLDPPLKKGEGIGKGGIEETDWSYISGKSFEWLYIMSDVYAFGPAPVDSFHNEILVDWDGYYMDRMAPSLGMQLKQEKTNGWFNGLMWGLGAGVVTFLVVDYVRD